MSFHYILFVLCFVADVSLPMLAVDDRLTTVRISIGNRTRRIVIEQIRQIARAKDQIDF